MSYITSDKVTSPRRHFTLIAVLDDGKTKDNSTGAKNVSIAVGRWKAGGTEKPVLAMRWNGDEENPIGKPQSRGLPTWFIVPQHMSHVILDRISLSEGKRQLLMDVASEFFAGPDGTGWICDKCGKPIRTAKDGVVEWVEFDGSKSHWKGRRMFVVHHVTASPLKEKRGDEGCHISQDEQDRTHTQTDSTPLDEFLGSDGLTQMLALISDARVPAKDVLETIQRLHTPGFERARLYIPSALTEGLIEPNLAPGFYWQEELKCVLENYPEQDLAVAQGRNEERG